MKKSTPAERALSCADIGAQLSAAFGGTFAPACGAPKGERSPETWGEFTSASFQVLLHADARRLIHVRLRRPPAARVVCHPDQVVPWITARLHPDDLIARALIPRGDTVCLRRTAEHSVQLRGEIVHGACPCPHWSIDLTVPPFGNGRCALLGTSDLDAGDDSGYHLWKLLRHPHCPGHPDDHITPESHDADDTDEITPD